MSRFDQNFKTAGVGPLNYFFGEEMRLRQYGGQQRTITGRVQRNPPTKILPVEMAELSLLVVEIPADQLEGIEPKDLLEMKDTLAVSDVPGGPLVERPIRKILTATSARVTVALVR